MKKRIKEKWLKDLRSGKFEQGSGELCYHSNEEDLDRYCCLGVLAAQKNAPGSMERCFLDENQLKWAGLTSEQQNKLSRFNDVKRWSFKKIAAYIERYL